MPIWEGDFPSLASLAMSISISFSLCVIQVGLPLPTGFFEPDFPRARECILAIRLPPRVWENAPSSVREPLAQPAYLSVFQRVQKWFIKITAALDQCDTSPIEALLSC